MRWGILCFTYIIKLRPLIVDDGMARILRLGRDYELSLP